MQSLSLKDSLSLITNPAIDFDPEDIHRDTPASKPNTEAREEYLDVGASTLRKHDDVLSGNKKYAARKISFEDRDDHSSESEEEQEEHQVSWKPRPDQFIQHREEEEDETVQQLRSAASDDRQKGKDVKKQIAVWETLLEGRIKFHKAVTSANILPEKDNWQQCATECKDDLESTLKTVQDLSELLFDLRQEFLVANESTIDLTPLDTSSRKRKRSSPADYLTETLSDLSTLSALQDPLRTSTLTKWSDKVNAASIGLSASNKFKAVSQNVVQQVQDALDGENGKRLVKRTQCRRGDAPIGRDAVHQPIDGEKEYNEEIFDDSDFYQLLLRQAVDSRATNPDGSTRPVYATSNTTKKNRTILDPKSSKGRKLRYEVHEKLQNFMAPVESLMWEKERCEELFRSLLGRVEDGAEVEVKEDVGGLRIFG